MVAVLLGRAIAACGAAGGSSWDVGLDLTWDGAAGLQGGERRDRSAHGIALAYLEWTGEGSPEDQSVVVRFSSLGIFGQGPTRSFVGDLLSISNAEGHASARLYASWAEWRHARFALRGGLLLADEEFAGTDAGARLVNASFGWPVFISANTRNTGPAFFAAGLGLRLAVPVSARDELRLGLYDGDTFDDAAGDPVVNRHGWHNHLSTEQGAFVMAEWRHRVSGQTRLKLGGWLHTGKFTDTLHDPDGTPFALSGNAPAMHASNHGAYAVIEHALHGQPGQPGCLDASLRAGASPADRNLIAWACDVVVAWNGPLPGRPDDALALGFTHAEHSASITRSDRLSAPAQPARDFEQVVELGYRIAVSERLSIQPDLQYVRHPGGSRALSDALVLLVRVQTSF